MLDFLATFSSRLRAILDLPKELGVAAAGTWAITTTVERTAGTSGFNPRATIYAREVGA